MNREILFRAKRADNKEWAEGYVVKFGLMYWIYNGRYNKLNRFENGHKTAIYLPVGYPVNEETLCQFTGLYDRNKKRFLKVIYFLHILMMSTPKT